MRILLIVLTSLVLGGCAVGRTASYADTTINVPQATGAGTLALAVQDRRPYVLSGNKPERFVGLMRGGFGNPFDVNTGSGGPLATDLRDTVSRSLSAKGYKVNGITVAPQEAADAVKRKLVETGARRSALLTLTEWKSDTMMNIGIHFDSTLVILDEKGQQLATSTLKGMDNLGSAGFSPEPTITAGFAKKLEALFGDPKVVGALR